MAHIEPSELRKGERRKAVAALRKLRREIDAIEKHLSQHGKPYDSAELTKDQENLQHEWSACDSVFDDIGSAALDREVE